MNVSSPPTPIDASNGIGIRPYRLIVAPHVALMPWCGSNKDAAARHVAKTFFFFLNHPKIVILLIQICFPLITYNFEDFGTYGRL